jgi:hypothetical protein
MSIESADNVRTAFRSLGDLLAFRGAQLEIVVVGGAAMLLLGVSTRVTKDVDVVAVVVDDQMTVAQVVLATVRSAVEQVARDLGLPLDWINPGPDSLLEFGLPDGFLARTKIERYGSLIVHVADRVDLIALKLYAAVDQGPESKHFQDLLRLSPTAEELREGAAWCRTHDPSKPFSTELNAVLRHLGAGDVT